MADVINTGDYYTKVQDTSLLSRYGADLMNDYKNIPQRGAEHDKSKPIISGLASDDDLLAQLKEGNTTNTGYPPIMMENAARELVKASDEEYEWAKGEAQRILNGQPPTNPFVDVASIVAGENTYDSRVTLGDVAVLSGDRTQAIAAYEDALDHYVSNPINIITGGSGPAFPDDLLDKLSSLGVSKDAALADIARAKGQTQ